MSKSILEKDPVLKLFYEMRGGGALPEINPCKSLGYLLRDGFEKAFTEDEGHYEFITLHYAFYFMRLHGIITEKTYETLCPLVAQKERWPWEYYEDGTVKFVNCEDYVPFMDGIPGTYSDRYDPAEALRWAVEVLSEDPWIRNYLCMDSFDEMIASAESLKLDENVIKAFMKMEKNKNAILCGDVLFHFEEEDGRLNLHANEGLIRAGVAGEVIHCGNDLYFQIDRSSSYLHVNARTGIQELCQNIEVLGFKPDGSLVYVDFPSGKVCFDDAEGNATVICDYDETKHYAAGDYLSVTSCQEAFSLPYRIAYDGGAGEASDEDRAACFWKYFLRHYTRVLNTPRTVEEALLTRQFRRMTEGRKLTLGNVLEALDFARKNKCWAFGPAFPLINSLRLLRKRGIGLDEDVSEMLHAIVKYNDLVNIKDAYQVTEVFYFILYRLSKRPDFISLLHEDPQRLFAKALTDKEDRKKAYEKTKEELPDPDFECCLPGNLIGVFKVDGRSVHAVTAPVNRGIVRGDEIVFDGGKCVMESHPGSVTYDLLDGKFIIRMEEKDEELMEVIRRVFFHPKGEVEYRFSKEEPMITKSELPFLGLD